MTVGSTVWNLYLFLGIEKRRIALDRSAIKEFIPPSYR